MRPARILLLVVAILAGGLAAFLAMRNAAPAPSKQKVVATAPAPATRVLVAKTDIGVGQRLAPADVEWQAWPDGAVRAEYITAAHTPDAEAKISGAVARFEIFPGEPILDAKLAHTDQGFLSAVLPEGMRGVSIPITAASGSGGFIQPNDRVDVVVTDANGGQTVSRVVLSDVKVLAIGTRLGQTGETGAPKDPTNPKSQIFTSNVIATLELSPSQADTLINSSATGKVSLVLRSVADFGKGGSGVGAGDNNQSVKVIRFGREANVMAGSASQNSATLSPAAFVPPAPIDPTAPAVSVAPDDTDQSAPAADGSVTVVVPNGATTAPPPPAAPAQ